MPILAMSAGTVTSVWGNAFVRLPNGSLKPIQVGDKVKGGEHIITDDDGIVEISPAKGHPAVLVKAEVAPESVNKAIAGIESQNPEDVPAAGITGGADGGLQPGLRVDRVAEVVGSSSYEFATAQAVPAVPVNQAVDPRLLATQEPASRVSILDDHLDVNEGAGTATFTITLDKPSTQLVTISYSTQPGAGGGATPSTGPTGDSGVFVAKTGSVTFQPGETSKTVSVTIVNDDTYEGSRTFNIQLGVAGGNAVLDKGIGIATVHDDGTGSHPADVLVPDDDRPHVAVVTDQLQTREGGTLDFHFKLTHDSTTPTPLTLTLGSGEDGALAKLTALGLDVNSVTITPMAGSTPLLDQPGTAQLDGQGHITFAAVPAGTTDVIVHVGTLPDNGVNDGLRTFQLTAATPYDSQPAVMIGAIDDRPYMLVQSGEPAVEGSPVGFNVVLTHAIDSPVTVKFALLDGTDPDGSAKVGIDTGTQLQYEDAGGNWHDLAADGQLTFDPGQTQLHLRVATLYDQVAEGVEYIKLQGTVVEDGVTANKTQSNQTAIINYDVATIDDPHVPATLTDPTSSGSEVFAWHFGNVIGAGGVPHQAVDTITHFHSQTPSTGGDVLDLRDLLQGENTLGGTGNLDQYLHFDTSGSSTVIHVAPVGDLDPVQAFNGPNNLQIVLKDVNLKAEFGLDPGLSSVATDQQIIAKLLQQGNLLVDHA